MTPIPRTSAAVLLHRRNAGELEVYLARRSPRLRFMGGLYAFPGGALEPQDGDEAEGDAALERCARRELAEEIGVHLPAAALSPLCTLLTPPFAPVRHRTRFFAAEAPHACEPRLVEGGELDEGAFFAPRKALAAFARGELRLAPPVLLLLERLDAHGLDGLAMAAAALQRELDGGALARVRFSPGTILAPLRTPTLPPATTTNAYLVGHERFVAIDPGSPEREEQERWFTLIESRLDEGACFDAVVLTHHHPDHVGAAAATCARFGVPLLAHCETLARLEAEARSHAGASLRDGDRLELGAALAPGRTMALEALHTPGHARGHLAFLERGSGALFAGDLLSTLSTIVIDPPEGHMATYLASLRRVRDLPAAIVYPSHGPPALDARTTFDALLAHRAKREEKLLRALRADPRAEAELLPEVYDDAHPRLLPVASRSLRAGLEKLLEEGRAERVGGETWRWKEDGSSR